MRNKACSVEFMRRLDRIVTERGGARKELVRAICHQTCLEASQVYRLLRVRELEKQVVAELAVPQTPHPTILIEALSAPNPLELVREAITQGWTAEQVRQEAARRRAGRGNWPQKPPTGKYRTIVVDPPWAYGNISGRHGPDYARSMMSLKEIAEAQLSATVNIKDWIPDDKGHLYLWVTDAYIGECYHIVRAWGYEPKCTLVWIKDRFGMGNYYRHQHELCVFAVKGAMRLKRKNASSVFEAKVTRHSEKPAAFYNLVESCSEGPYLDVFARCHRPGWDVYGNEVSSVYQQRLEGSNESALVGRNAQKS